MKTPRDIVLICLTSLSFYLPVSVAAQNNQALDFSKAWFKPFLTVNKDPVCASLLAISQREFFSLPSSYSSSSNPTGPIPNDPNWILQNQHYATPILIKDQKVYERGFIGRGCGGACESEYLALSKIPFPELGGYSDGLTFSQNQTTEEVPAYLGNSGLYKHYNGSYYGIIKGETTNAYKLLPNATWDKVCAVENTPAEENYKKAPVIHNSISQLTNKVNVLMGEEGYTCGSMRTLSRWKNDMREALAMAMYRPWALYESSTSDSTYAIDFSNMESWSLKDISQKLAFEEYKRQLAITTKDLSLFYQKSYQWPAAISNDLATTALKAAISSGIRFYMYDQISPPQKDLINAITNKQPISVINSLADAPGALTNINLSLAINNPQALELLLATNSNPNQQNEFKKSLLMYAAQYNQLESARVLIKHNTDVNLSTIIPSDDCKFKLSKFGMTAIHYAVRYASYDFVKLLLDNGAYPYAKTSEDTGGYPIDWLKKYTADSAEEKNPNINKEQTLALETILNLPTPENIAKKVMSYNLIAEQELSKGNIESAYKNCKYALWLAPHNERALANLSLIALKIGKNLDALEASDTLFTYSKDTNQVANAWFNYGLACERQKEYYGRYNGKFYCNNIPITYFLESYKTKQTSARANKIISSIKNGQTSSCNFSKGEINLFEARSIYKDEQILYVLKPKEKPIDSSKISWTIDSEDIDQNQKRTTIKITKTPKKLIGNYELGDFTLTVYSSDVFIYSPIEFDGETCSRIPQGGYIVVPSAKK